MSQPTQSVEEVFTYLYIFKLLLVPTIIGTVTGYISASWRTKYDQETRFKEVLSNCGISAIFCCMAFLGMYEWTSISSHLKLMLCIAVGFTATHWYKHLISIMHLAIERFLPLSTREKRELRKMQRKHEENEYRSPKRIPKEFLDDDDGSISITEDHDFCEYPPKKIATTKKKALPPAKKEDTPKPIKKASTKTKDTTTKKKVNKSNDESTVLPAKPKATRKPRSKKDVSD